MKLTSKILPSQHSVFTQIFVLVLFFMSFIAMPGISQTSYLSEDFESGLPSTNFALKGPGIGPWVQWQPNTNYAFAGSKSAWLQTNSSSGLQNGTLESRTINLSASTKPLLTFYHICALERYYDQAIVEVSTDGGVTWVVPSNTQYNGNSWRKTGSFDQNGATSTFVDGPYFDAESRPEWDIQFTGTGSTPVAGQSLWMKEVFDLSAFKSSAVKVRFRVKSNLSNDFYGWLIDNVTVAEAPPVMTGTRLIGSGGFASFRAATQALSDSGVGAGGVTILAAAGTYNDSLVIGYYRGTSASNRVVFKSQSGPSSVIIQRMGANTVLANPTPYQGYSYTQFFNAIVLMSGAQYVTFDGITLMQQNWSVNTAYGVNVGFYLTNGCRFDSVYRCTTQLQNRYYYSVGMMVVSSYYSCAPGLPNVGNKLVNDTIVGWNGVYFISFFPPLYQVYDSSNSLDATVPGATFLNLGQSTTQYAYSSASTQYATAGCGQDGLTINNIKVSSGLYINGNAVSSYYQFFGFYCPNYGLTNFTISNNQFTNIGYNPYGYGSATTYACYGIYLGGSTTYPIIRPKIINNTFSDWYTYYMAYFIYNATVYEPLIQGNTVTRLNSYYEPTEYGFYINSCIRPRVIGNRFKDIRLGKYASTQICTWAAMYFISNTGPTVVLNNMISDVSLNQTSAVTNTLYGIYFSSEATPSAQTGQSFITIRDSICNNSIWLADTKTTPYCTSYGLYYAPSTSAGMEMYIYNNIIGNRMAENQAGYYGYAMYRASTAGTVYSDFNCIYGNTTGSGDIYHYTGYYGGTNCYQLSDWRTASSAFYQDIHSFVESPPWSTTDSLHLAAGSTSRLYHAGKGLLNVTTDFDGTARAVGPTIGAHEGSLSASSTDDVGPAITYLRVPKTQSTAAVTITATITDASGVNTSTYPPLIYYKPSTSGTWSSSSYTTNSGSTFTFTIPSQALGTKIQFYLAAQDLASTPNGSTFPNGGLGTNPPGSTAPGNANYMNFWDTCHFYGGLVAGDYWIGGTGQGNGQNFPTLKAALDSVNLAGITGPVRFLINTATLNENPLAAAGPLQLLGPIMGSSPTNTITIKPNAGFTPQVNIVTGVAAAYALEILGASNIIIDGSNTTGGSTKDMTWTGGSTSSTTQNLIQFFIQPALSNIDGTPLSVSNITVKNLKIRGGYTTSLTSALSDFGVLVQGTNGTGNVPGANATDITVTNNTISEVAGGVRMLIFSPDLYMRQIKRVSITNNLIGPGTIGTDSICSIGILLQGVDSVTVDNNDVQRVYEGSGTAAIYGVQAFTGTSNLKFTRNKIHNMLLRGTAGQIIGIYESSSWPNRDNNLWANNMVYDLHALNTAFTGGTSSTGPAVAGIFFAGSSGDIIADNSVNMFDTSVHYTYTGAQYTEAFGVSSSVYALTIENNIFSNNLRMNPTLGFNIGYELYYGSSEILFSDNNIIVAPGGYIGYDGYRSKYIGSFDSLKMMTSGDVHSWNQPQAFLSNTDAHLNTSIPTRAANGGIPVAGVTVDIDNNTRSATTPCIGAQEATFPTALVDISVTSVQSPTNNTKFVAGTGVRPIIAVTNFGTQNAYSIPIVQNVYDSTSPASSFTVSGTIDSVRAGETRTITIDSVTYPGTLHTYGHRIYANYSTDANHLNDSSSVLRVTTVAGLSGIYTVGSGQWAPTIKAAFDSLVNYGLSGNVTFQLTDAVYNQVSFNTNYIGNGGAILGAGPSRRLRIKPAPGVSPYIYIQGSTSTSLSCYYSTMYPGIGLQNTSYLTWDGCNTENGTTRNTTVRLLNISSYGSPFMLSSTQFDSVKNCIIMDSTYYSGMSGSGLQNMGIIVGPVSGSAVGSSNNVVYNNQIRDTYFGVMCMGGGTAGTSANNSFVNNLIDRWTYSGVYNYYYSTNTLYQGNLIQSDTTAPLSYIYGIFNYAGNVGGTATFNANKIWKLRTNYYSVASSSPYIYAVYQYYGGGLWTNNLIAVDHDTSTQYAYIYPFYSIYGAPYPGYPALNMYFNTFYTGGTGAQVYSSYAFFREYIGGDFKNNVLVWDRSTYTSYLIYDYLSTYGPENWNNNLYMYTSSPTSSFGYWYNGTSAYAPSNFATWQSNTGYDSKSWFESQVWQDSVGGNFSPVTTIPTRIESHGTPIPGITTDINGNPRNPSYPDLGAFEGNYTPEFNVDAVATSMSSPTAGTHYYTGTSVSAQANFQNGGVLAMSNTPITYQALDASGTVQATSLTSITSMAVGGGPTSAGTFNFTPTTPGTWKIRAFATALNEEYTLDDTVSVTINVTQGLAGSYNVGVGQYAPTIKASFDSIVKNGIIGAVNFNLTDNAYNEPAITGNQTWSQTASTPITYKPIAGVTPVINFNPTATRPWGIRFNSLPSVTFDGSNITNGTTRNTTLQFASGNTFGQAMFWLADSIGGTGNNNFTVKNTRLISGGTASNIYGIYMGGTTLVPVSTGKHLSVVVQNNEIRNAGYGVFVNGNPASANTGLIVTGNQIGPLVGDNTLRIGAEGVRIAASTGNTITSNEITGLYSNSGGVAAIDLVSVASGGTIALNKLHDIEAAGATIGSARGIVDNGGGGVTMTNNMIWHVISNSSTVGSAGANAGIYLGASAGDVLYFNSIGLTGNRDTTGVAGTGTVSAALYVASTASNLTSINNIFGNLQTEPASTRKAYGYVLESISSLAIASNNNISGAGSASVATNALIAGTPYTRMLQIRATLGGSLELNSFTPTPAFISDANLHINTTVPTLIESGGIPIAGITTDIDGNTRNVSTPDVGANEGGFLKAVDVIGVSIDQPLNQAAFRPNTATPHVLATFRNGASGTGTNIPVTAVTYDSLVGTKHLSATVIIPTLGPGASTQVSFDSLLLPDIGSYAVYAYANYGFDVDNSNDTTASIRVIVCQPLAGTYNVGVGKDFANLSLAVQAAHDCGVQMRVNYVLTDATYNESGPISFNGIVGLTSANIIVVKPALGVSPTMNIASSAAKNYGILLDSASYVTLDGSNTPNGNTRNWTINLTGSNSAASVIYARDCSADTIKNLIVRNIAMASGAGITVGPTRVNMTGMMILNNDIATAASGIVVSASTFANANMGIWNNNITGFSSFGIQTGDKVTGAMIRNNTISSGATMATSSSMTGISISGPNSGNIEIGANKIMDFSTNGSNPVISGVVLSSSLPGANVRLYDNMISLGRQTAMPTATIFGIQLNVTNSALIQNNTVALGGTSTGSGSSYVLWGNAPVNVTLYNNIFSNGRTNGVGATGVNYAMFSQTNPSGTFASDYNDWYVTGPNSVLSQSQGLNMPTLVAWRMVTNGSPWGMQDRNSVSEAPNFVATSDLHVTLVPSRIQNGGMPGTMGSGGNQDNDIDGNPRGYVPDIGATEFNGPRNNRLVGSYTIDPSTGNFPTLAAAIRSLDANGADGAVDIYMLNGTDTTSTPLTLVAADGIGPNNPVRFHAPNGNGLMSSIVGTSVPNLLGPTNLAAVIVFDSAANNISIDGYNGVNNGKRSLSIVNATAGFANSAIIMTNGASSDAVNNSIIWTPASSRTNDRSGGGAAMGVVAVVSGQYGGALMNNLLQGDSILNGWDGVYSAGASGAAVTGLMVRQTRVQDFNSGGIFFGPWTSNSLADGNYITSSLFSGADATVRGIRLSSDNNSSANAAGQNWIINVRSTGSSNVTGIEVAAGTLPAMYNNFIALSDNPTGSLRGIDDASSATATPTLARIFFNSIHLYGTKNDLSTNDYAIAILNTDGVGNRDSVIDNIFSLHRATSGQNNVYAVGAQLASDFDAVDYNDYFMPSGNAALIGSISFPSLATLRSIPSWSSRDANSITGDPLFVSNTNLHLSSYSSSVFYKGLFVSSIQNDIDYESRSAIPKPEIGADENAHLGTLPVELVNLDARGLDRTVDVTFRTAEEKNAFGFAVLRSDAPDHVFAEIANANDTKGLLATGTSSGKTNDYTFVDNGVTNGTTYYYKIVSIDNGGTKETFDRIASATPMAPEQFSIIGDYPNPFSLGENASTKITYSVGAPSTKVEMVVMDLLGHTVRTLTDGPVETAGVFTAEWDGKDMGGSVMPSGTYMVTLRALTTDGHTSSTTVKIVLTK